MENQNQSELTDEISIVNTLGLHARPAAQLVQTALRFSIGDLPVFERAPGEWQEHYGVLTLAAAQGSLVTVWCKGPDAQDALGAIRTLIDSGFGED